MTDLEMAEARKAEGRENALLLVVRVRGSYGVSHDIEAAMKNMRLTRRHHAALLQKSPSTLGALQKAKDYLTWGEASEAVLEKILASRARLTGDKPISNEWLAKNSEYKAVAELAKALFKGSASLGLLESLGIKQVFRLHPPKKGFGRIKEYFPSGALGYRGTAINKLVEKML